MFVFNLSDPQRSFFLFWSEQKKHLSLGLLLAVSVSFLTTAPLFSSLLWFQLNKLFEPYDSPRVLIYATKGIDKSSANQIFNLLEKQAFAKKTQILDPDANKLEFQRSYSVNLSDEFNDQFSYLFIIEVRAELIDVSKAFLSDLADNSEISTISNNFTLVSAKNYLHQHFRNILFLILAVTLALISLITCSYTAIVSAGMKEEINVLNHLGADFKITTRPIAILSTIFTGLHTLLSLSTLTVFYLFREILLFERLSRVIFELTLVEFSVFGGVYLFFLMLIIKLSVNFSLKQISHRDTVIH